MLVYGITGLRDFKGEVYNNKNFIFSSLDELHKTKGIKSIVSGGGKGVEVLVDEWAKANSIELEVIPPNIKAHGVRDAFLYRDTSIAQKSDSIVIFWDGLNNGVIRPISNAIQQNKPVFIIPVQ